MSSNLENAANSAATSSRSALDLDELERRWKNGNPNLSEALALIQRLREVEADNRELEREVREEFSEALGNANAHIARLERVREAADQLGAWWKSTYRLAPEKHVADDLLAALAGMYEKP